MKRRIAAMVATVVALSIVASGCADQGESPARPVDDPDGSAWAQPPHVETAVRDGADVVVRGRAGPDARVVLRGPDGAAVAVAADKAGRFELRVPTGPGDIRLTPEVQIGEDAAPSPETLLLVRGGAGPLLLIAAGQPTRRLDGRGVLDAVDADGAAVILSGRTAGDPPTVTINGARVVARVDAAGVWRATAQGGGASTIDIDGIRFAFPGLGSQSDFIPVRAGEGWRLTWPTGSGGRQTTWLPDRSS